MYKCSCCKIFFADDLRTVLGHIYHVHSQSLGFSCKCLVEDCSVSFGKYNSLYKHTIRHHKHEYNCQHHHQQQENCLRETESEENVFQDLNSTVANEQEELEACQDDDDDDAHVNDECYQQNPEPSSSISDLDDFIITDDDNDVDIYNEEDEVRKKFNFIKLSFSFFL